MFGKSKEKKNNDNELESYGVWVKHGTSDDAAPVEADTNLDFNTDLDLPDFEDDAFADSDFSDMFKDEEASTEDTSLDFDTTLSADELANITDDSDITTEEIDLDTTFASEDEIADIPSDETAVEVEETPVEETANDEIIEDNFEIFSEEETPSETPAEDDLSLDSFEDISDDFNIFETEDSPAPAEEAPVAEETVETEEEITAEETPEESEEVTFGEDEEISLDDFMDGGFSDESVASGNNGFEPGKEPAAEPQTFGDEEISLDDFIDDGEFETTPDAPVAQEDTSADEPPLEMDISFDDSADTVETEDNIAAEASFDDDQYDDETEETAVETEEVSINDFGSSVSSDSSSLETEEIDLSDFGIDSSAEETPITQDVEESKMKETVVDYDLSVANDNTSAAPVVNVIPEVAEDVSDIEEVESIIDEPLEAVEPVADSNTTSVNNSLLEQIVADLSGLKDEINQLKVNLAEIKEHENAVAAPAETDDIFESEPEEDIGGFFASDDTDDTIALSADELSNIMNTTSVVEETVDPIVTEESEPVMEETFVDVADEPADEPVVEETPSEEIAISEDDTLAFNYENEDLQEPDMSDISIEESDFEEESDLPSEITIEKNDDILVESDTNDFMDSVADSTPENTFEVAEEETVEEPVADEPVIEEEAVVEEEPLVEETFETVEEPVIEETITDSEPVIDDSADISFDTVDSLMSDDISEEPVFEETVEEPAAEEPVIEDTIEETVVEEEPVIEDTIEETFEAEEEPVVEETAEEPVIEETSVDADFSELDQSNNDLSESNINYLTAKNDSEEEAAVNSDLKQDIKSVLLYMDQLLENLPEDKIIEFAKSDEFTTYKKLFSELGLS